VLLLIGIVLLALVGVPLYSLFGISALILFFELPEGGWEAPAVDVFGVKFAENPTLVTIPLFTFAGYMLAKAKTPERLVEMSRAWLGWLPGGLAGVCLMASAFFTTFTGGSGITIVAVGGLLLPSLIREGYPKPFSMGLVTTSGSLGLLFPPSVPLILYGIVAGLVMDKVIVAGLVPGTFVMLALGAYGAVVGARANIERHPFELSRALRSLWVAKWEIAIPLVLIGGMGLGLLRIHEASAFTAMYVLLIEVFIYRDISIQRDLPKVVIESMTLVGVILLIMATALGFNGWMVQAEIANHLLAWMDSVVSSKIVFLLMVNLVLLVVGMLMDIFTAIVVVVPLITPMAAHYGVDPYHMAIIFLLNLEIGYLTPPVGLNLFISSVRFGEPVTSVYRTVVPFIGVLVLALGIVTYVPILTTWLPNKIEVEDEMQSLSGGYMTDEALNKLGIATNDAGVIAEEGEDYGLIDDEPAKAGAAAGDAGVAAPEPPAEDYGLIDDEPKKPADGAKPAQP
jgi:C4-dicarboxylate transporter DctM subunit